MERLTRYLLPYRGWRGYFGFCKTPRTLQRLDEWIRTPCSLRLLETVEEQLQTVLGVDGPAASIRIWPPKRSAPRTLHGD
ncbi:MAG: group II intron maturase-specific domain-containing protein [Burkholderia sp.]